MNELTIIESAKFLGVGRTKFEMIRHRPGFPRPIKLGERKVRFLRDELEQWKLSQRG